MCYLFSRWPALLAVQATSRINNLFKWANYEENGANKMRLNLHDGAWHTEHKGTMFVIVSGRVVERGQFFVHQDNIWRSLTND